MPAFHSPELPNPFLFNTGRPVRSISDWSQRRLEIANAILPLEYGGLPPSPQVTTCEIIHTVTIQTAQEAQFLTCRVQTGPDRPFAFLMTLLVPAGKGPYPVILTGDACWRYATDAVALEVIRRGYILAQFNRVEIATDVYRPDRTSGLYPVYPERDYSALSAWAWGYHRCVDVLSGLDFVDAAHIAIVGHSRGGKTTLLAGATDPRIALTCANDSGAGGAGCFRFQGPQSETIKDLTGIIDYWFGPHLKEFIGREADLPFDQHYLKALIAPRPLLTCEALGDLWANPAGTRKTHLAAREVYRFLGVEKKLGIWFREGNHTHGWDDWMAFLDFTDGQFGRAPLSRPYDIDPFADQPLGFTWRAPNRQ